MSGEREYKQIEITDIIKLAGTGIKSAIINIIDVLQDLNWNMTIMRKKYKPLN